MNMHPRESTMNTTIRDAGPAHRRASAFALLAAAASFILTLASGAAQAAPAAGTVIVARVLLPASSTVWLRPASLSSPLASGLCLPSDSKST